MSFQANKKGKVDRAERSQGSLVTLRGIILTLARPIYSAAQAPYDATGLVTDISTDRQSLLQQRDALSAQLLQLNQQQQRLQYLQAENARLRQLLNSKAQLPRQATIAEIIGVPPDPLRAAVILDKGSDDGVAAGDAVVDEKGLFGQVVTVSQDTCWVVLITDRDHAIPARNNRTGVRMIVGGTGAYDNLVLEDLPASTDLLEGDLIETSGLGGRFPVGNPIGKVNLVERTQDSPYLQATLVPTAALLKVGHVLIIAPPKTDVVPPAEAVEDESVEDNS